MINDIISTTMMVGNMVVDKIYKLLLTTMKYENGGNKLFKKRRKKTLDYVSGDHKTQVDNVPIP